MLLTNQGLQVSGDRLKPSYLEGGFMTPLRRPRLSLVVAMISVAVFGVACSSSPTAAPVKAIFDKGTPYGDLMVPKLTASVTDGAVGVTVDAPVTVSVADGVLGSVTMVNDSGKTIEG